ncbi:adenylate/guanylate cyclase domain-containing protein [uncultured Shimia sp.]|uniref:adenylate/guanylate cyclase domain-containing protein n=1 Tax=uncultured Shimia sp. TaxID=573152 RepID=UPI00263A2117|nr:adenylate/guanylate cyclase domain-containing protein [uncultured Shimia sp.]
MARAESKLWQGNWRTKARIVSGLILFFYVFFHLISVGMGLFSLGAMEISQGILSLITKNPVGTILLYGALLTHLGLALYRLARRRTLRMPMSEASQIILGISIPFLLMVHFVHTQIAERQFGINVEMGYIAGLIWDTTSGWQQGILVLVVWIHGCIGLHFWLRVTDLWKRLQPLLIALAALMPAFALAGFLVQGRTQSERLFRSDEGPALAASYNFPSAETFGALNQITDSGLTIFAGLLALTAAVFIARRLTGHRHALRIQYIDGPEIQGQRGMTLLEMSRASGVPHMSLCGGRGRCTTCRVVIEEGADLLHPPSPQEESSLRAVNAPPNARLACQIRPTNPATVLRVFRADGQRARAHESLGQERRLAILFLDMRGFTARTTGQLPYDVVFLLNRFFDAIVPSITGVGGTVDKYLGDGLLALFELDTEEESANAALQAAAGISSALEIFNKSLDAEGSDNVRIGIGLHLGDLVLGEIGAAENAPRTIIGDTVNAASRLESETKVLGVELLVSESLLEAANAPLDGLRLLPLRLRGVAHTVNALAVPQGSTLPQILKKAAQDLENA